MTTITAQNYRNQTWMLGALLSVAAVAVSYGAVHTPFIVAGAVLGAAVLAVALVAPLALVTFMLVTGPIDMSFMTGGFKALFSSLGGLDMNGIRLVGATAGFAAYMLFDPRSRAAAVGPFGRPWVIFLTFAAATITLSLDRLEGLRFLFKLAYPFLTFLIVIAVAHTRQRAAILMKWVLAAAIAYTLIINPILVAQGGYRIDNDGMLRIGGLGTGENPFAFYVLPMLMIVFTRFIVRVEFRYLWFSLVLLGWIGMTGTRIAALTAVIGMAIIGALGARSTGNKRVFIGTLAVAVLAGMVFLPSVLARSFGFVPTPGELFQLMRNPLALYNSINFNGRQLLWAVLWGSFITSPVIGLGLGSSTAVIREVLGSGGVRDAHNDYIRLATDTGVLGVLLFIVALGTWLTRAVRLSRINDRAVHEYAFAAAALAAAFMVVAITDNAVDFYSNLGQYLGFLMGCAYVTYHDQPQDAAES